MEATFSKKNKGHQVLKTSKIDTPIGSMLAVADDEVLYLLEFVDGRDLEKEMEQLKKKTKLPLIPGKTKPIEQSVLRSLSFFR